LLLPQRGGIAFDAIQSMDAVLELVGQTPEAKFAKAGATGDWLIRKALSSFSA